MTTKVSTKLTLKDILSRLTFTEACKLLGDDGKKLIKGGSLWDIKIQEDVYLGDDLFRLTLHDTPNSGDRTIVTMTPMADARRRLHVHCSSCDVVCEHRGAALALVLEEKLTLGLAAPPPERIPVESLAEDDLICRALDERAERARAEKMKVAAANPDQPWTDYNITSTLSGKTYRVALRGTQPGDSYCSCPDFRTNTLGTCKHILHVLAKAKRKFTPQQLGRKSQPKQLAVHLRYGREVTLQIEVPPRLPDEVQKIIAPLVDRPIENIPDLLARAAKLEALGEQVVIYPDAEEFIQKRLNQQRLARLVAEIRKDPQNHPLRTSLVKVPLLPYQLDGIAFAAGAGRAVLADDMGLGKTIQGVGLAELLARNADIKKVLVVCPASLKSQWRSEIRRFCDRDVQLVVGKTAERTSQYDNEAFFTICNYEQVLRDLLSIQQVKWDLIILDEGQRIKNWETRTSQVIKGLRSPFALVLSGTPLENRLDDLYSVVQFIDDRRLGPGFRFFNRHRVVDEKGKILGYKNLSELRETLRPVLLRRTRESVKLDLPQRTSEIVRIAPTDEQAVIHAGQKRIVASIITKKFISEMDLLRLRQALMNMRMAANSTYLVTKEEPSFSSKLERLNELVEQLFDEANRKAVLFSEWTTMLNLIEPLLARHKLPFVRLDGSVPQKKRQELVHRFQTDGHCKLFLTTNAGSTGLNLQAANTVINVDLPWNPAILEQRIARAHRMGQTQPVQVFVLVTEQTIEEELLKTLSAKKDLALAALDPESEVNQVDMASGMDELRNRLEVLLGARPEAPVVEREVPAANGAMPLHRERVAAAGGELLGAAFKFLGELVAQQSPAAPPPQLAADLRQGLETCVESDPSGRPRLSFTLPDRAALDQLAATLAQILVAGGGTK
ncbi:MAG TPA: DEAD/DEAH box helicase [Pirellulaceae bacterium]|nr:DEAD/DEAH box helicase [Pirellulaceae bacterium]